jgi:hypothetical protein
MAFALCAQSEMLVKELTTRDPTKRAAFKN